ncbi:TIGR02444 family protein [Halomonas sp.]|uniref:TIGR02444 family protein n=1 Tax=Halomonas sp. TaxID=1486246 RepID=UPI0025BC7D6D|nr:TIGR02444 family protein [Halomonas sp.]
MTAILRARLTGQPLWEFALALYGQPGVESACLALQDQARVDVCELLWRCWLLRHGVVPGPTAEEGLVEVLRWQREVTAPLRRLRRRLKPEANVRPGVAELRETLKHAELQAERETLDRLERLALADSSTALTPAPSAGVRAADKVLANALGLQKKTHLSTLHTLVASLDPPSRPR